MSRGFLLDFGEGLRDDSIGQALANSAMMGLRRARNVTYGDDWFGHSGSSGALILIWIFMEIGLTGFDGLFGCLGESVCFLTFCIVFYCV